MTEDRGTVLRRQYDDLRRRIDAADESARAACLNYIRSTFNTISDAYELASSSDRGRMLKAVLEVTRKLWEEGNRPQVLALGVIMLNIESRYVAGDEAAFVKAETDALIEEASASYGHVVD
jgi:hypothetical protein